MIQRPTIILQFLLKEEGDIYIETKLTHLFAMTKKKHLISSDLLFIFNQTENLNYEEEYST